MKTIRVGNGKYYEVPTDWVEAEKMLTRARFFYAGRGSNSAVLSACTRVSYGLLQGNAIAADPTEALVNLMVRICKDKGAGLD